jgi:retinol dehydrogenase-12/retinol dehydrogenase-13
MKTILITGSNSGIGKEAALILAKAGHQILMLCRDSKKSTEAHLEIVKQSGNQNVVLIAVDLSERNLIQTAITQIKSEYEAIDVLVNNAGLYKPKRAETADGVEMTFAVNYLAPFMLSQLLLENLMASGNGRIINVSSQLYESGSINLDDLMMKNKYKAGDAYANSKLAGILYTIDLAKKMAGKGITVNALHPGVLATDAFRDYPKFLVKIANLFLENPQKGGERIAYLATSDEVAGVTGRYFFKKEEKAIKIAESDRAKAGKLWQLAEELTGLANKSS